MIMGCYGLGIGRTVAAAVEQSHDDDGIIWPMPIAPFEVWSSPRSARTKRSCGPRTKSTSELLAAGIDVLFDDRDERPGVKFKDADLIGFPLRIAVGAKSLAERPDRVELAAKTAPKQLGEQASVVANVMASSCGRRVRTAWTEGHCGLRIDLLLCRLCVLCASWRVEAWRAFTTKAQRHKGHQGCTKGPSRSSPQPLRRSHHPRRDTPLSSGGFAAIHRSE